MHGEPNQRSDHGCTDNEDAIAQAGVLGFVIEEHPDHMTLSELVLAKRRQPERRGERDLIEQAVRELVGAGLLHRHGEFVVPTRAALFMSQFDLGLA
jgi:hypothetical protein